MKRFDQRSVIQKFSAIQNIRTFLDMLEDSRDTDFSCIMVASSGDVHEVLTIRGGNMLAMVDRMEDLIDQYDEALDLRSAENN